MGMGNEKREIRLQQLPQTKQLLKLIGRIKLADLMELSESDFAKIIKKIENEVEPHFLVEEADEVAKKVKEVLSNELEHLGEIMVYVEYGKKKQWEEKIKLKKIQEILSEHSKKFINFHDLRIIRIGKEECANFHIVLPQEMSIEETYNLSVGLEENIRRFFPKIELTICFDQLG